MKLKPGFWPFNMTKRRPTGRIPTIKIRSYVLILSTAIVPLGLFFAFSFSQVSRTVTDHAIVLAETLRDSRSERLMTSVRHSFTAAVSAGAFAVETGTLTRYNAPNTVQPLVELLDRAPAIERIALYDPVYVPVAAVGRNGTIPESELLEQIRVMLPGTVFENQTDRIARTTVELDLGDRTSRLVQLARISTGTRVMGYLTAVYDYSAIPGLVRAPAGTRISVFNGRYQRIADSSGRGDWQVVIDPLTERMLDGFTETVLREASVHSYGYIDFDTAELFLDVAVPLEIGSHRLDTLLLTFFFFLAATALGAVAVAWAHVRSVVRYGESILINSRLSREMRLFSRFSDRLSSLQESLRRTAGIEAEIEAVRGDVMTILDELPSGDADAGTRRG